jgi:hypothetical protein
MENQLKNLEIKKMVQEYNFLLSDSEYKKEMIETYREEFLKEIQKTRVELNLPTPEPIIEQQDNEEGIEEIKEKKINPDLIDFETKIKIKKIYREIVKKTHPDRIGNDEFLDVYMEATKASDEYDVFTLFKICNKLNIPMDLDSKDKVTLEYLIKNKKDELNGLESSFIWKWITFPTEEEKKLLINLFLKKHG